MYKPSTGVRAGSTRYDRGGIDLGRHGGRDGHPH